MNLRRRIMTAFPMWPSEKRWLAHYERQRRDLTREGLCGKVTEGSAPGPLDTRVGGPLVIPKGADMLSDEMGRPLLPLVLIRLSDLPVTAANVLPRSGWIQVAMHPDPSWDMPMPMAQGTSFRIMHYAEGTDFDIHPIDQSVARAHIAWTTINTLPALFEGGLSLQFAPVSQPAPSGHYMIDSWPNGIRTQAFKDAFDAIYYRMEDEEQRGDVFIAGHAEFTQEDVRYSKKYAGFENLIRLSGAGRVFSWGDAGEATVMVPENDLGSGRLDKAVFHFDGH